jgi:hypothetical protein
MILISYHRDEAMTGCKLSLRTRDFSRRQGKEPAMRIAEPCHESWNQMQPVAAGRHCAACEQTVVDLTGLAPAERRMTLATIGQQVAAGRRVCVRGRVDRDGMLAGSRRVLTGGMAAILAMTIAGCVGNGPDIQAPVAGATQTHTQGEPQVQGSSVTQAANQPANQTTGQPQAQIATMGKPSAPQRVIMGDVAEPPQQPVKMGEMVCTVPPPVSATAPVMMGTPLPPPVLVVEPILKGKVAAPQ